MLKAFKKTLEVSIIVDLNNLDVEAGCNSLNKFGGMGRLRYATSFEHHLNSIELRINDPLFKIDVRGQTSPRFPLHI